MLFSPKDIFPLDNSLGFLLNLAAQEIGAHLSRTFKNSGCEVTPQQWGILNRLWEQEGLNQNELAEKTLKDRHNVARMLALMEKNGLIERRADPHDQRVQRVYLTQAGRTSRPKLTAMVLEVLDQAFQGISAEDAGRFREICIKMINNLNLPDHSAMGAQEK